MAQTINHRQYVLGYPVDLCSQTQALTIIKNCWQGNKDLHVITLNAEMIMSAQIDKKLDHIIRHSNLVIPDGAGVVFALRLQGYRTSRLPGIELSYHCLQLAAKNNIAVALIGSSAEVIDRLKRVLPEQMPGLHLVFCHNGYFDASEQEKVIADLNYSKAQLVLIAMGVPRQEYFIEQAQKITNHMVFIGVGGSFDVWVGEVKRAPEIWQNYHLEWFYRLVKEPWRFKRMSTTLPKFAFQIILNFLKNTVSNNGNKH